MPKKGDHYENDRYVISSAVGHVAELLMPEDIDKKKYGFWRLETLPIIPEKFELKPSEKSKDRFAQLKKLIARKDIDEVINACDAGREGELIFTYLAQLAKNKHPVKRLWLQSMTPQAIRDGFRALRDGAEMKPFGRCGAFAERKRLAHRHQRHARDHQAHVWFARGQCRLGRPRADADARARLCARVGDPEFQAARLLAGDRRNSKSRKATYEGIYQRPDFKKSDDEHDRIDRIWDQAAAEAVVAACQGQPVAEVSEEKKASTQIAPRLYDLTTLQREANGRFGFSAKRTLQIAQALYEKHKMLTYPRTDSRALPEDYLPVVTRNAGQSRRRAADARAEGARARLGPAEQAHLQQRADQRSLRHYPDGVRSEEPR